jgi:RND family efflux transporter MFP subunit
MADDDLARLHLDKAQLGRRGARKSRVILVLLLVAAMLGGGWLYRTGALTPAIPIRLVNAATLYPAQTLALLNASGYVVAQRKAALGSKITSRLVYLGVAEGQRVKEGQVVARLENEDVLAARNRAQANIAVARATLAQVETELRDATQSFERAREMRARKFASPSDYDAAENRFRRARAAVAVAQASLRASEAALAEAEVQLSYTEIRAPFDAVVLTKNADIGDIVTPLGAAANARASVVTIADMGSYQVEADVSETNIGQVRVAQPCEIQLDALPDVRLRGQVQTIVPTADRSKASVLVKVAFIDQDPRILPEMSAKVAFLSREVTPDERPPVTAVPVMAVRDRGNEKIVYTVRDHRAVATPVQLGRTFGDQVEVLAGIKTGEPVILKPPVELEDGAKVRAEES